MPVVSEANRVATLREWGISEPLIRLACGEDIHPQFGIGFRGPPWYTYRSSDRSVRPPRGPRFAPLWEFGERVTGVWQKGGGLEFIRFSFGDPQAYEVLARTEQGFWAVVFDFLYEGEAAVEELRAAAAAVGFQFLDRLLSEREAATGRLGTFEAHRAWLEALVAGIDQE
jgi:hypothetical protein